MSYRFLKGHLCLVLTLVWLSCLPSSAEPSKQPMNAKWKLIAQSDLIARAKLHVPPRAFGEKGSGWISLEAAIERPIKGCCRRRQVPIRYYREDLTGDLLAGFAGKIDQDVILFLVQGRDNDYFVTRNAPEAVIPFSSEELATIEGEVSQQQEIGQHFDELSIGKPTDADSKIQQLFDSLTKVQDQETSWEQLLKLSRQDVPSIVKSMNDQRLIPEFDAYVPTPNSDYEGRAHYGPRRIIEAASIILPYLSGDSFRFVYNGGSERELLANLYAWRCWCAYNL